jgi:PhzF family phenazine biosynthesis protein
MEMEVYTLNAFTKGEKGGNPAGVVLGADDLSARQMQRIAAEVGFSETAFLQRSEKADILARFFTPTAEVPICGHATIAAFHVLLSNSIIQPGMYTQETKAGILEVEVQADGFIFLAQPFPLFEEEVNRKCVAHSLNIDLDDLVSNLPVQIVSTGLRDVMVPVRSLQVLEAINPNFDEIAAISQEWGAVGYHVFYAGDEQELTAYCRNFAPLYGIMEESATGSSTGALSCYLYEYGKLKANEGLRFEQGHAMGSPSELKANLFVDADGRVRQILVGGTCSVAEIKTIQL